MPNLCRALSVIFAVSAIANSSPATCASETDWWRTNRAAVVEHPYRAGEFACSLFIYDKDYAAVVTWRKANPKEISFYDSEWRFQTDHEVPVAIRLGETWLGGPTDTKSAATDRQCDRGRLSVPVSDPWRSCCGTRHESRCSSLIVRRPSALIATDACIVGCCGALPHSLEVAWQVGSSVHRHDGFPARVAGALRGPGKVPRTMRTLVCKNLDSCDREGQPCRPAAAASSPRIPAACRDPRSYAALCRAGPWRAGRCAARRGRARRAGPRGPQAARSRHRRRQQRRTTAGGFFLYVRYRMSGFGGAWTRLPRADVERYPDYKAAMAREQQHMQMVSSRAQSHRGRRRALSRPRRDRGRVQRFPRRTRRAGNAF